MAQFSPSKDGGREEEGIAEIEKGIAKKLSLREEIIEVNLSENEEGIEDIDKNLPKSLVGMVLTERKFRADFFKSTMVNAWRLPGKVVIKDLGKNLFYFTFATIEEKEMVLEKGPWSYENNLLVLRNPDKDQNPKNLSFEDVEFWVQIHNLPLKAMKKAVLVKIGSAIGKVTKMDENEEGIKWGTAVRLRIAIQLANPLKKGAYLKIEGSEKVWIEFKYERLPKFCTGCGIIGHSEQGCDNNVEDNEGYYDEDIKAKKEEWRTNTYEAFKHENRSSSSRSKPTQSKAGKKASDVSTNIRSTESKNSNESKEREGNEGTGGKGHKAIIMVEDLMDTATSPSKGRKHREEEGTSKDIMVRMGDCGEKEGESNEIIRGNTCHEEGETQKRKWKRVARGVGSEMSNIEEKNENGKRLSFALEDKSIENSKRYKNSKVEAARQPRLYQ